MDSGYRSRIADSQLRAHLARSGAVLIEGARACGKTSTALEAAASAALLDASPGPRVDEAATALLRFASRVSESYEGAPAALVVIVGSGPAYVRPDGVQVVPIWALEP